MNQTKEKDTSKIGSYLLLIPIIFALTIIPALVRVAYFNPNLAQYSWFSSETSVMDMFMHCKKEAMLLLDGMLLIGYVYILIKKKIKLSMSFLPLFVYFMLAVFSAIASVAPYHTWHGFYGMMESAYVIFGYCLICYYAYTIVETEKQLKIVMTAFAVGTAVMGLIAVSQFTGNDFFMTDLGKSLTFPAKYAGYKDALALTFGKGMAYTTLYNPNYVGVYSTLLVPVGIVLLFSTKGIKQALLGVLLIALVLTGLVSSGSQSAILALVPGLLFMIVYFGKRHWKTMIPTLLVCGAIFAGLNAYQGERNIMSDTADVVGSTENQGFGSNEKFDLTDITLNDTDFTYTYKGEVFTVQYIVDENEAWSVKVHDAQGKEVEIIINQTENGYAFADEKYSELEFVFGMDVNMNIGFSLKDRANSFFIYYSQAEETYLYTNAYGRSTKIYAAETYDSPVFDLLGGFNGRDFIWSKSIPILKETIVLGSGPDTYAFMFPQYDYVALEQDGWSGLLITKPHSLYLQIGIQTGVFSLIAFLVFNIWYLLQSLRLYYKRKLTTFAERCGAAVFIADIGYLIVMLANDSTIGVSIIYWTLMGLGFACNEMIKKENSVIAE